MDITNTSYIRPYASTYLVQMELQKQSERMVQSNYLPTKCIRCGQLESQQSLNKEHFKKIKLHDKVIDVHLIQGKDQIINDLEVKIVKLKTQIHILEQDNLRNETKLIRKHMTNHQEFIEELEFDIIYKQKFVTCLLRTVAVCHPDRYFMNGNPSLKQAWKWIKFVLQDYMRLKRLLVI